MLFDDLAAASEVVAATTLRNAKVTALAGALRALEPDVVHTTLFEADVVGRLASVGMGPKVMTSLVSTPYGPARRRDPNFSRWKIAVQVDAASFLHS